MTDLIDKHLRRLRADGFAEETIKDRRKLLRRLDAQLPFGIEEATVEELSDWLAQFRTNQTKATYYGHIVGFYGWACGGDDPYIEYNPAAGLTRPKVPPGVPNPIETDELDELLARAEEPFRTWLILAAYAGLRPVEIAKLERRDVTEATLTIRGGKGGKNEILPTHPMIWNIVKDRTGRIAETRSGIPPSADYISARCGDYLRTKLGVYGVGCRRLRHWYATTALAYCHDLRIVQELMRHSSPATTAVYTKITGEQRRSAVQSLPALGAPASR